MPQPIREYEDAVNKQIREAIERGEFDRLPGKGKPLDLDENPHVPEDWRLAFKMLKDANASPEWIEERKELGRELEELREWLEKQARFQRQQRASLTTLAIDEIVAEHARLEQAREETAEGFRSRARLEQSD